MKLTAAFLVIITGLITLFDVYQLAFKGYDSTISWVLYTSSQQWPIIPFALGVLCGHLFFPNRASLPTNTDKPPQN
jgi:hypothetical protein